MPRTCGHQRHRASIPASNPSEYFRRTITVPIWTIFFLSMTSGLIHIKKNCFSRSILGTISVGNRRSCNCVQCDDESVQCDDENGRLYAVDLPNVSSLSGEICNWYNKWKYEEKDHGSNSLPSTLSSIWTRISSFYPNIKALVTILCTLPVTSCTAERSFSSLNVSKLSSMSNERLSNLTLLHMHQAIPIDIEEVIDEFSRRHPRRIQLSDSTR